MSDSRLAAQVAAVAPSCGSGTLLAALIAVFVDVWFTRLVTRRTDG